MVFIDIFELFFKYGLIVDYLSLKQYKNCYKSVNIEGIIFNSYYILLKQELRLV